MRCVMCILQSRATHTCPVQSSCTQLISVDPESIWCVFGQRKQQWMHLQQAPRAQAKIQIKSSQDGPQSCEDIARVLECRAHNL